MSVYEAETVQSATSGSRGPAEPSVSSLSVSECSLQALVSSPGREALCATQVSLRERQTGVAALVQTEQDAVRREAQSGEVCHVAPTLISVQDESRTVQEDPEDPRRHMGPASLPEKMVLRSETLLPSFSCKQIDVEESVRREHSIRSAGKVLSISKNSIPLCTQFVDSCGQVRSVRTVEGKGETVAKHCSQRVAGTVCLVARTGPIPSAERSESRNAHMHPVCYMFTHVLSSSHNFSEDVIKNFFLNIFEQIRCLDSDAQWRQPPQLVIRVNELKAQGVPIADAGVLGYELVPVHAWSSLTVESWGHDMHHRLQPEGDGLYRAGTSVACLARLIPDLHTEGQTLVQDHYSEKMLEAADCHAPVSVSVVFPDLSKSHVRALYYQDALPSSLSHIWEAVPQLCEHTDIVVDVLVSVYQTDTVPVLRLVTQGLRVLALDVFEPSLSLPLMVREHCQGNMRQRQFSAALYSLVSREVFSRTPLSERLDMVEDDWSFPPLPTPPTFSAFYRSFSVGVLNWETLHPVARNYSVGRPRYIPSLSSVSVWHPQLLEGMAKRKRTRKTKKSELRGRQGDVHEKFFVREERLDLAETEDWYCTDQQLSDSDKAVDSEPLRLDLSLSHMEDRLSVLIRDTADGPPSHAYTVEWLDHQ